MSISDMTNTKWKFYINYENGEKKYRWSRKADNGNIVGASTQGYESKTDCISNAKTNCFRSVKTIVWKDDEEEDYRRY